MNNQLSDEVCDKVEIVQGKENPKKNIQNIENYSPTHTLNNSRINKPHQKIYVEKGRFDIPYNYDYEMNCKENNTLNPKNYNKHLPPFYGYCYCCDYARHSQNYCPLKLCYNCKEYGHSIKVCQKPRSVSKNWRTQNKYKPPYKVNWSFKSCYKKQWHFQHHHSLE